MKKNILTLLIFGGITLSSFAQQDALFTQYIDAQLYSNAASAGANDVLSFTALHRQQWAGYTGAPMTTGLIIDSPLSYESIAVGAEVWNDKIGSYNRTTVGANFAYRFRIGKEGKLSVGVKGIADFNSHDFSDISNVGTDQAALGMTNTVTPNVGAGVLYRSSKWFAGAGLPRLLTNSDSTVNGGHNNVLHGYFLAGVIFDLKSNWKLRASTQVRAIDAGPVNADLSLAFVNNDKFWVGLNYRFTESAGVFFQYQIASPFKVGYAFDYNVNSLRTVNYGSHEILLQYAFNLRKEDVMSPRYF